MLKFKKLQLLMCPLEAGLKGDWVLIDPHCKVPNSTSFMSLRKKNEKFLISLFITKIWIFF